MPKVSATERVRTIEYAIRDVLVHAKQIAKTGKKIYYLNIGDPVAFDFNTPRHIRQALERAVEEGANAYAPSEGISELREAISRKEKRVNGIEVSAEDVIVTTGISEGIQMVMAALIDAGDEILLQDRHIRRTFPMLDSSEEDQSPMKLLRRTAGNRALMI